MDDMEHKSKMVQMLLDMLQKSSGDEMSRDMHPSGLRMSSVEVEPKKKPMPMAEGGMVSPDVDMPKVQDEETPLVEQAHREEEPEDIPAVARLKRRK